jgi:hypothetical protein
MGLLPSEFEEGERAAEVQVQVEEQLVFNSIALGMNASLRCLA